MGYLSLLDHSVLTVGCTRSWQLLPAAVNIIRDAKLERHRRGALQTVLRGNRCCGLCWRISVGVGGIVRANRRGV
jgi:hypothetical protein